jgi:amidohydrolase
MVEDGALDGVDAVLALHVGPGLSVGDVAITAGPVLAGVDSFSATIIGRGGHGASPHKVVDPIYLAGHVILALHGIVSRRLCPSEPAVVSVGAIHGGQADNVIPERVEIAGTVRFTSLEVRGQLRAELERAFGVARALGGAYELRILPGGLPVVNDAGVASVIKETSAEMLGSEHVAAQRQEMGAEDFGAFLELAPGAVFLLGCRMEGEERALHHPRFDVDERCLPVGAAVLAGVALRLLHGSAAG